MICCTLWWKVRDNTVHKMSLSTMFSLLMAVVWSQWVVTNNCLGQACASSGFQGCFQSGVTNAAGWQTAMKCSDLCVSGHFWVKSSVCCFVFTSLSLLIHWSFAVSHTHTQVWMAFITVTSYFSSFETVKPLLQLDKSVKEEVSSGHS